MSPIYSTPTKTASVPFVPTGVYRGRVVNVNGSLVDIEIPRLTGDLLHTNIEVIGAPNTPMLAPRDLCYVAFVEGYPDELVVLGNVRLPSTAGSGPAGDVDWTVVSDEDIIANTQLTSPFATDQVMSWQPDPLRYRKTAAGVVYIAGNILIPNTASFTTFDLSTTPWKGCNASIDDRGHFRLFQLPVGYRPYGGDSTDNLPSWLIPVSERTNATIGDAAPHVGVVGVSEVLSLGVDYDGTVYLYAGRIKAGITQPINFSFYAEG